MTNSTLTLRAGMDRVLAWHRGKSVRHIVATVQADRAATEAQSTPVAANLALVIDASGSMSGRKLERAKQAVRGVIDALANHDRLSVVSFASDVIVHADGLPMDEPGRAAAWEAVHRLETRGSTNLSDGWFTGAACIARRMAEDPAPAHRIVLLSDGMANEGVVAPAELAEHAAQLQLRGIVTSTVGIGDDYEAPVLQALAEHGGGQMHDAEHGEEIVEVLLGELRDTQHTAVEQAVVGLDLPPGVEASLVGFYPAEQADGRLLVRLGSLGSGLPRHVVVKLTLPDGAIDEAIPLRVTALGTSPGSDTAVAAAPQDLAITLVSGRQNDAQERDQALSVLVAQAWHAAIVRAVARMNRSGERRQARHYLERELRYFERYCRHLPGTEDLIRELTRMFRHIDEAWDERTRKEMELSSFHQSRSQTDHRSTSRQHWIDRLGE